MTALERATAARWCAWLVFAAIVGLTVTAAVLAAVNGPAGTWLDGWCVTAPSAVALSLPAVLLASRRPRQPVAWLLLGGALAFAVDAFSGEYATWATVVAPGAPLPALVLALGRVAGVVDAFLIPWLLLVFPDGRAPSPGWRGWRRQLTAFGLLMLGLAVIGAGVPMRSMDATYDVGVPPQLLAATAGWSLPISDATGEQLVQTLGLAAPLLLFTVAASRPPGRSCGPARTSASSS